MSTRSGAALGVWLAVVAVPQSSIARDVSAPVAAASQPSTEALSIALAPIGVWPGMTPDEVRAARRRVGGALVVEPQTPGRTIKWREEPARLDVLGVAMRASYGFVRGRLTFVSVFLDEN